MFLLLILQIQPITDSSPYCGDLEEGILSPLQNYEIIVFRSGLVLFTFKKNRIQRQHKGINNHFAMKCGGIKIILEIVLGLKIDPFDWNSIKMKLKS